MKHAMVAALLVFGMAMPCHAQEAAAGIVVANETLGVSVTKPRGWHTLTAEANAENLKQVEFNPDLQTALAKYARAPVIAFTKFAEPYNDLNPSFKMNVREAGNLTGRSALEILNVALQPMLGMLHGRLNGDARQVTIGGLPGAYARIDYDLKAGGATYPTASELWIVPRGSYFFLIGAGTRQDEATGTRAEIAEIVESISFHE